MNNIYSQMNRPNNIMSQYTQFKNNPSQFLANRGVNIPQEYINNPQAAVQYLLNSGRMSQQGFNNLSNMAKTFKH